MTAKTVKKAPIAATSNGKVKDDFVVTIDDVEIRLPSLAYLKPGLVRRMRRLDNIDALYTLIELCVTPEAQAVLDDMDPEAYAGLLEQWREHSGVSLGE